MTRRGFTIVEVLVAIVLLAIGVLGVAGVSVMAMRQTNDADQQNVGALVAQSHMERIRSLSCTRIDQLLASPLVTTDRNVRVNVSRVTSGTRTRVVAGQFSWTTRRNTTGRIADTTTVNCS